MIRAKNIDYSTPFMKEYAYFSLGSFSTTNEFLFFTAPYACEVQRVDILNRQATTNTSTAALVEVFVFQQTATANVLGSFSATTNITAATRNRINFTANNSLTQGTTLGLRVAITGSQNYSQAMIVTTFYPLVHKDN